MLAKELLLVTSVWPCTLFHLPQYDTVMSKQHNTNCTVKSSCYCIWLHHFSFRQLSLLSPQHSSLWNLRGHARVGSLCLIAERYSLALEMDSNLPGTKS